VEDLGSLVLNGLDFNLVRWVFALAVAQRLLQSVQRVLRDGVAPGPQELSQFLHAQKKRIADSS
jgi:hypothetical protein